MIFAFGLLSVLAVVLFAMAYRRKDGSHIKAVNIGGKMLINLLPLLLVAFVVAGMLQVALPPELIQSWLGEEAGYTGILVGGLGGALIPGGPYVSFPIIASIFKAGAGIGTAVAFVSGWAMLGIGQMPFELAIVGPRFMLLRLSLVVLLPFIAGGLALVLFG
ncbi:permease [Metallumcola ferriviriculae]|uniref:Permease n=1 Tax=Metallumcola ferriviriculae TaxID=3039180 RepID=A0AAU0UN37_9FIRM|nr:permease [Desulfitibacteraceae bacterium MK1]